MARRKTNDGEDVAATPSFEDAIAGLEAIVESMEHEHLTLEQLVAHYEKGSTYLARCESILQSARGRIELITLRNQGDISLDAGIDYKESPTAPLQDDPDDDNDIRLF